MATHPRLVNKQFNSPIGLYSSQNVQEVLERETQILSNGAVGINFHNPGVGKPANLQKSAVLRMLEEEESRQRNGFGPSSKRVAWPPPNESGPDSPYVEQNSVTAKGGPQYPAQSPALQRSVSPNPLHQRSPLKPLDVSQGGSSPLASPQLHQAPQSFRPATPSKGWAPVHSPVSTPAQPSWQAPSTQFQSAHQPVSQSIYLGQQYQPAPHPTQKPYKPAPTQYQAPQQQYQSPQQQYQAPQQQYQSPQQQYQSPQQQYQSPQQQYQSPQQQYQSPQQQYQSPQPQFQAPQYPFKPEVSPSQAIKPVEPPPSIITLRSSAPVSQAPPPVYNSQPATATLKGGKHLRGDLKWPPENVKSQAEEENRLRLELAKGPVFRPKRPNKDYTSFFAQHALNSTYPGYKIPPGTQYIRQE